MEATVLAGIDWANKEHQVFVTDAAGKKLFEGRVPQTAADLAALSSRLIELAGGNPGLVAVAIERPHGLVVEALASRGIGIYSINPKQLDRFRDRFSPSGAKDDRRDAEVLASSLRTDPSAFRKVEPTAPLIVELCEWSRMRHEEKSGRTRLCNRLREQLLRYFPQVLELDADPGRPWMLALWRRVRTPQHARSLDQRSIAPILKKHRIRKVSAKDVLETLCSGPFHVAEGVTGAATAHIEHLVRLIEVLNEQIKAAEKHLEYLLKKLEADERLLKGADPFEILTPLPSEGYSTATIVRSLMGIGTVVMGSLFGEASQLLVVRNITGLRLLSGVAPVTRSSGKSCYVLRRLSSNPRLRDAMHHMAATAMQHDPNFRASYKTMVTVA